MADMIPRDAAIAAISALLSQATHNDPVDAGYRSCVGDALSELRAIPTIDPAAIREAALESCTIIDAAVKEGHDNITDLILHLLSAVEPAQRALALIGEKK